jgi:flagellin-like protein
MTLNRKGITPIISVILLLMMVIAIAGIAYTWLQGMQESIQTSTENTSTELLRAMNVNLRMEGYTYNCSGSASNVSFFVRNAGSETAHNLNLYVEDEYKPQSAVSSLAGGTSTTMVLNNTNCVNWVNATKKIKVTCDEMTEETNLKFVCSTGSC